MKQAIKVLLCVGIIAAAPIEQEIATFISVNGKKYFYDGTDSKCRNVAAFGHV